MIGHGSNKTRRLGGITGSVDAKLPPANSRPPGRRVLFMRRWPQ